MFYRCTGTGLDVSWEYVFRGQKSCGVRTAGAGPVCSCLLQTSRLHVRGVDPSDLRMSMKNSLPVNQKDPGASHAPTAVDLWTMILLPVLCETIINAIGPLVT